MRIGAHFAHAHQGGQHRVGRLQRRHADGDRSKSADLLRRRHRAFLPRIRFAVAAIVDQREALAFRVLEVERHAAVALDDVAGLYARLVEALLPPREAFRARDAQARAHDRMGAALLGRRRPVEEGQVGARARQRIGVEQVIGRGVVLVHGLLHHAHAHRAGVEALVPGRVGRDRCQVMDAGELHDVLEKLVSLICRR